MPPRTLELLDALDPRAEAIWRELETRARPTYFLSWSWIDHWLHSLPVDVRPGMAVVANGGAPVAACFLGRRRERRRLVMTSDVLYLNATGWPRHDELCVEHNGLLATPGAGDAIGVLLDLYPGDWDELVLPAVDRTTAREL